MQMTLTVFPRALFGPQALMSNLTSVLHLIFIQTAATSLFIITSEFLSSDKTLLAKQRYYSPLFGKNVLGDGSVM